MEICKEKVTNSGEICDLHAHTHFSDGSLSPTELVELARETGLSAVALTDHNTVGGVPELLAAARGTGVRAIPGIEFSTDWLGVELHVIALGFSDSAHSKINELVNEVREEKRRTMEKLITDLRGSGYNIDRHVIYDGVEGIINRAHVATELVRCGYASSRSDAFSRILYSGGPFYKEPKYIGTAECIDFINSLGAVSVLAHPFLNIEEGEVRELLSSVSGKLCAMEALYSEYDTETTRRSLALCREFGLLPSGGSDFHGKNKPDIALGTGRGNLMIPLSFARDMGLLD